MRDTEVVDVPHRQGELTEDGLHLGLGESLASVDAVLDDVEELAALKPGRAHGETVSESDMEGSKQCHQVCVCLCV